MEFSHVPVLYNEVLEGLKIKPNGTYVDGTLGGGGHAEGLCSRLSKDAYFIGIDRDIDAINAAGARLQKLYEKNGTEGIGHFVHSNYSDIKHVLAELGILAVDGAMLDLGVSSFQLDNSERGFSYMHDGPLDMRMNVDDPLTAAEIVNSYSEAELVRVIREYGEENWASRIAKFICEARKEKEITSTFELVDIIKAAIPANARREGPHPAKRTFQALRMECNQETWHLKKAVNDFIDVLAPGGRLCIISFHSLEDRIVKETFQKRLNPCTCPPEFPICVCGKVADVKKVTGKPILPSGSELETNPRARSAKLRIIEKL